MINKIIAHIKRRIATYKTQKRIFETIQKGNMVWCKMPLSKKQLKKIEESHRVRPYLIVDKGPNFLLGYYTSSKNRKDLNNYQKYIIKGIKYKRSKDSCIDLTNIKKVRIRNIKSTYIKLSQIDIKNIEKRIRINQYRGNRDILRFNEPIYIEVGDVIQKNKSLYYIYSEDNVNIYGFKIQKRNKQNQELEKIKVNKKKYYANFKEFRVINRNDDFEILDIATDEEIIKIFNEKNMKKRVIEKDVEEILERNNNEYQIGTVFKYGKSTVMYLYTENNKFYGVDLLWYKIKPRLFEIKKITKKELLEIKELEEINKILEFLIEKNIQNSNIKKIHEYVREMLYFSMV